MDNIYQRARETNSIKIKSDEVAFVLKIYLYTDGSLKKRERELDGEEAWWAFTVYNAAGKQQERG